MMGHRLKPSRGTVEEVGAEAAVATGTPTSEHGPGSSAPPRRRHPVRAFLIRRTIAALVTLFVISILVFLSTNVLPGDPASAVLGRQGSPEAVAQLRGELGLDRPLTERYFSWLGDFVTGDFGLDTIAQAQGQQITVSSRIADPLMNSLILAAIAMALLIPISLVLGTYSALRAGGISDHAVTVTTLIGMSLPEFVAGSVLVTIFFSWLDVLPPVSLVPPGGSPLAQPEILVLPVLTLLIGGVAWSTRLVRAGMIEVLKSDYVELARLNGLAPRTVLTRYALRNALAPSVQIFAILLHYMLGAIVVTEAVFSYPGVGTELVTAVSLRDLSEIQALAMILAIAYLAISLVADLLVMLLVPKLRLGG